MSPKIIADIFNRCKLGTFNRGDLGELLSLSADSDMKKLFAEAYSVKCEKVKPLIRLRGIIEFSNICSKDCYYCGIRKSNQSVERFSMQKDEIVESAKWAYENQYGSIVLQSGERNDSAYIDFVEECLLEIKKISGGKLGITLSLGEQTEDTYKRWFKAGAHRYLLRIETSNSKLYKTMHPKSHNFEQRKNCLKLLRSIGYQVGTGIMIGLPNQEISDLADDIIFFKKQDIDMIGMGPYIEHENTPLALEKNKLNITERFNLALKVIAVTRLVLQDVNIAATTALQAIDETGREQGIMAGANVVMPNIGDIKYRDKYQLYEGKPCLDENAVKCRSCLDNRIRSIGEEICYNDWGDSPHFFKRKGNNND